MEKYRTVLNQAYFGGALQKKNFDNFNFSR